MHQRGDTPVPGYTLAHFLGRGGYGEVWQANAPGGAPAALKFVLLTAAQGLKEYRAVERIKAIRHANLLPIHAFWVLDSEGRPLNEAALRNFKAGTPGDLGVDTLMGAANRPSVLVMAMPLGDKNLSQRLSECRKQGMAGIPPAELLDSLEDAAKALDYLNSPRHDLGEGPVAISHADVKPQNIMLVGTSAQLCDFGLARVLGNSAITTSGGGTPAYIPPEILSDRLPAPTSDQYSLALTYVELRTGRLPFSDCDSYLAVLDAHLKGNLDFSSLPEAEQVIIKRAAARQPADRYATCMEMIRALRAACPAILPASWNKTKELQETQDISHSATPLLQTPATLAKRAAPPAPAVPLLHDTRPSAPSGAGMGRGVQFAAAALCLAAVVAGVALMPGAKERDKLASPTNPPEKAPPEKTIELPPAKIEPKQTDPKDVVPKQIEPAKVDPPQKKAEPPAKVEPKQVDPPPREKSWQNSVGMTLLLIPAGEFSMGSPATEADRSSNEAAHRVEITRPFYLAAHETTQAQFQEVLGRNPSHFSAQGAGRGKLDTVDPQQLPVEMVSYTDAVAFCEQLSARPVEKEAGRKYRLPTEAEWEYACRAGTATPFSCGDTLLPRFARCDFGPAGGVPPPKRTAPVGSLAPNSWGLFDMHGNVAEWCSDWYLAELTAGADPKGPAKGTDRLLRGGGFYASPAKCRSADRYHASPGTVDFSVGFRVLCETK